MRSVKGGATLAFANAQGDRDSAPSRTNREIAHELEFSVSTVKNHVEDIISKLDASVRTQAVARAVELGVISAER